MIAVIVTCLMVVGVGILWCKRGREKTIEFFNKKQGVFEDEQGYLNLMKFISENGYKTSDRTGTGNRFLPCMTIKYNISDYIMPLLTTRKIPWKNVVEELLFFLKGKTDTKELEAKNVNIWKQNTSEAFIKSRGLNYREGVMGPMYGYQWRYFNAVYKGPDENYNGQGIDQIKCIIQELKENPNSRRIYLTAWNPVQLNDGVLPPCHHGAQWVHHNGILDCILYQRSCDLPLGAATNVPSYSLLTFIFCYYCGLKPGTLTHVMGHSHIYENQISIMYEHIKRKPTQPPVLLMKNMPVSFENLTSENFELVGYNPQSFIRYPFST